MLLDVGCGDGLIAFSRFEMSDGLLSQRSMNFCPGTTSKRSPLRKLSFALVTSSQAEEDVAKSYRLSANAYVTKPIDPAVFLKAVNAIGAFWLEIVKLP